VIDALRELGNVRDDHGLPSLTVDNIRREIVTMKSRLTANDNDIQPTRET